MTDSHEIKNSKLSVRAINALREAGYTNALDCKKLTLLDLYKIKHIGKKTAHEILDYLESFKGDIISSEEERSDETPRSILDPEYLRMVLAINNSDIGWSVRALSAFKRGKIRRLMDLVIIAPMDVLASKNCGKRTLTEIQNFLQDLDLYLGMKIPSNVEEAIKRDEPENPLDIFLASYPHKKIFFLKGKARYLPQEKIDFYKECYDLYKREGTLQAVAVHKKLTRERIRQILVKGTDLGLFKYSGHEYPFITKEKILADYEARPSLNFIASKNCITARYLSQLLTAYQISPDLLAEIRSRSKRRECVEEYRKIEAELGHHPTTTELQKRPAWHSLHTKIGRLWGTMQSFRRELSIPAPMRVLPERSRKAFARAHERRTRLAFIVRMQNLDLLRERLASKGPMSTLELSYECGMKPIKTLRLLGLLIRNQEVKKIGESSATKYRVISQVGGNS